MRVVVYMLLLVFAASLWGQQQPAGRHTRPSRGTAKPAALTPLSPHEQAAQFLNRFTFGPRPGEIERVVAMTPRAWFEQQLSPDTIKDDVLNKRLGDYPTLNMSPEEALATFPDRGTLQAIADNKRPMPSDPALVAVYEVQLYKLKQEKEARQTNSDGTAVVKPPTDAERAEQKQKDEATAARVAGDLFTLPRNQRMNALLKLPVEERLAFTAYASGEQRNLLLGEFNPRERELFYAMAANVGSSYRIGQELAEARVLRSILSERQLQEVMTDFWFNHFNVYVGKDSDQWYTTTYERDIIRKHALGNFRELLLATATSPAMMVYLDNWLSIGPDSLANGVNPANPRSKKGNKGLNENYGREVMELHTVGVNGGYTQADVTALSAILTGWTVDRPGQGGPFQFDIKRHEPGPKQWLGSTIATNDAGAANLPGSVATGMGEGVEALNILASSPKTAHFVSYKLAQRFVADEPPPALVDRMAATFVSTDGDIKAVLRTLAESPEFNSRQYFRNKMKTPIEFLASAFRTTATDPVNPGAMVQTLRTMGMPLYLALPPTGYPMTADHWMNSTALVDRLNFAYSLTNSKFANQKFDSAHVLALGLMSQPSIIPATGANAPRYTKTNLTKTDWTKTDAGKANHTHPALTGQELALNVLESSLIGDEVSPKTNALIHQQIAQLTTTNTTSAADTLNLLTALVMGSPEFQRR